MPALTLEQVLARSMRLPRSQARHSGAAARLFAPSTSAVTAGARPSVAASAGDRQSRAQHQQTLSLFDMLEKEEDARQAGHLRIHPSARLVRNSSDLLSFLKTARRMQDWEDGLRAFAASTGLGEQLAALVPPAARSASPAPHGTGSSAALVTPTSAHVTVLLDSLAAAGQWAQALALAQYFGVQFPDVLVHAVRMILGSRRVDSTQSDSTFTSSADAALVPASLVDAVSALADRAPALAADAPAHAVALHFLERCTVSPEKVPVECFNAILSGCEDAKDWRAALRVARAMGANPLQHWQSKEESAPAHNAATTAGLGLRKGMSEAAPSAAESSSQAQPQEAATDDGTAPVTAWPPPDVVSYATLIATLEQAGKDSIAAEVLSLLPPLEKEEITAAYAALVYVWSGQVYQKQRRKRG